MKRTGVVGLAGMAMIGCSGSGAAPGPSDAAAGSTDAPAAPDGSDAGNANPNPVVTTSAACGAIAIGGAQAPDNSGVCVSCVNAMCCAEAVACAPSNACPAYDTCRDQTCNAACASVGCVGAVTWLQPQRATYDLAYTVVDFGTAAPIAGATIKVCSRIDTQCTSPAGTFTTNAGGLAMLTVPSGPSAFDAYFEISGTGLETTLVYVTLSDPTTELFIHDPAPWVTGVFTTAEFQAITAGSTLDPARGHLTFVAVDCAGYPLGGVSMSASTADSSSVPGYLGLDLKPSPGATQTSAVGLGAILDLPPGSAMVTGMRGATRLGAETVNIRAGTVTSLTLSPTP